MMTRNEIYGGSLTHEMVIENEVWVIPDHTDERVLFIAGGELEGTGVTVVLPARASVRQHGWLVYLIVNTTTLPLTLEDENNNILGSILGDEAYAVGLISAVVAIGPALGWAIKSSKIIESGSRAPAEIVNLGGSDGGGTASEIYTYSDDTWRTAAFQLPSISGTGELISAVGVPTATVTFQVYYGQSASFFEYSPISGTTQMQLGNFPHTDTGLAVILGSAIGDLMHVSNGEFSTPYKMEAYGAVSDAWTFGNDFPSFQGFTAPERTNCVSSNESAGGTTDYERSYTSPSTHDTSAMLIAYLQQPQTYFVAAYPPWPRGSYLPSMIGIGDRLHFQGGSYSESSTVAYSTDAHAEYNPFFNSWQVLPALPVVARGMGICQLDDPLDRYFFGQGENVAGADLMYQYSLTTRTYTSKGTQAWGTTRPSQNTAWARSLRKL